MVAYDRAYEMVGMIDGFAGPLVILSRPTGLTWSSRWVSVRQGTEYERRQLRALAELHRLRQKGLVAPGRGIPRPGARRPGGARRKGFKSSGGNPSQPTPLPLHSHG